MDFSTMSDEELLKPDAGTDFSAMSDEELLKPDAKDDISKLSDEELLKPDAPQDLEQLSDEELLKPDAQPSQTQEQQAQEQPAAVTQQPAPAEQPQDTHWQEMDERARQFNLGDAISDAAETVGRTIGKGLDALESGKRRLEGILFPAGSLQSEMAAGGGAVAGKMMKTAANVPLNAIEAAGNMFGQDQVRDFAVRAKKFIDQKIDTTTEPLVTGNPEWDKKLSKFSEMGTNAVATLFAYTIPYAATVDIAATSINTFFNRLREGLDKGMTFNKASAMALVDAGLEGLKGVTIRRLLKGANGPGAFFDKLVEEGLTALKFAGIDTAQDVIQQGFEGADNPDMIRAKERGQEGLENAVAFQTIAGASRKAAGVVFDKNTDPKKGIQDLEAEREQTRQKSLAEEVASKFTPEQETALNERIPEFIGADTDLQIRVRDRIAAKMKREATEGSPVGKDPLRSRLDDPAEMEKEIQIAAEELLFEDNAAEIAKNVNTDTLGVKAGDQIVELVKVMPRTADKTESRLAGEIRAANPEMDAERVWELAEYFAAHEGEINQDGKPLTKERVAEVEKLMSEDASGTVPVEQPDGSLKTVGEMEAEAAREERKNLPPDETKPAPDETNGPVPETKQVGLSGKWTPVDGKSGVWHTPEFPDVEIALQDAPVADAEPGKAPGKIMFIENLPEPSALDENGQMKLGKFLADQLDIATKAGIKEINIGKTPEDAAKYSELVDKYEAKISGDKFQARADGVLGVLKKSGLATEVVATEAEFNAKLEQEGYAMRAKDGRTYGFTDGKNVYLNPAFFRTRAGLNTPIHEFGHLGIEATKKINRPLYDRGVELIKQTGLFKEVSEHPDYAAGSEEARATEALTRLIAARGENLEANTPKGVIAEIKKWLVEFWKSVGQSLGIRDLAPEQISKMTVEDVADAIRAEMMSGREFGTRELSLQEGDLKAKILRFAKYQKPTSKNAKAALDAAKKAWKGLSEEQKTALGQYGDTAVLKTPEARTIANGVKTLREWDARRAKISAQVKEQIRKSPNEAQKKFITSSPKYYISEVAGDATSPFAYAVEKGLPIPRKGDWGWDAWERLTDGMKYKERRELEKILGGEHPKRGGMDTVLSDYAQWLGISWNEGARDFEHGRGIEDFLDDILKERERFEKWRSGDRMTRTEAEAESAAANERAGGMTDAEFAEEDAWVKEAQDRRVESERMGEQDDLSDMPAFSRAIRSREDDVARQHSETALKDIAEGKPFGTLMNPKYGEIRYDLGSIGVRKPNGKTKGGKGFLHIVSERMAKDGATLDEAIDTAIRVGIAAERGTETRALMNTRWLDHNGVRAIIALTENGKPIITGYEIRADETSAAFLSSDALRSRPVIREAEIVAALKDRIAKSSENGNGLLFSRGGLYTGSAADYEKPSLLKVGTGEGSQVYGWGLYASSERGVAETYVGRYNQAKNLLYKGKEIDVRSMVFPRNATPKELALKYGRIFGSVKGAIFGMKDEADKDKTYAKKFREAISWMKNHKDDFKENEHSPMLYEQTFFTNRAPGDESHLLKWYEPVSEEQKKWILAEAEKEGFATRPSKGFGNQLLALKFDLDHFEKAEDLYEGLSLGGRLGSPKAASEFLARADIDGIKYPVDSYGGKTVKDGDKAGWNYVSFRDDNITVDHKWRDGEMLFSRGSRAVFVGGRTRVADDAEHGERSPGGLAAARELADVRNSPVSALGARRFLSLSISDMEELRKIVTGDVVPTAVAKNLPSGGIATRRGNVTLHSDVIGTVDRTDMDVEKATLKAHGFFRNEDPSWSMGQTDAAIRAEKQRSDAQLERQLIALGERRINRQEPGAQTAERGVFADQVAKIVMAEKRHVGGRLGRLQTIGKAVQDAVASMPGMNAADAEWAAKRFIDWAYGIPDYSQNMSGKELTAEMFGKWLVMPKEVEARAPEWANGIEGVIAGDRNLADAFRTLADRRLHGDEYLIEKIRKQMSRETQETLNELKKEINMPISAGSKWDTLKEIFVLGFHDKMGSVSLRINASVREKLKAKETALRDAPPNMRPQLQQQIDLYLSDIAYKLNAIKVSRQAVERGTINEGSIYFRRFVALENEALERWGLSHEDIKLYMDQWRVIETGGRSASFGEDVVQARRALGDMANRLGAQKWRRMQQFGNEFFAIHEKELLNDERTEQMLGRPYVDYMLTQVHYVTTKRVHSQEELDAIEVAKRDALAAGVAGGDDVVSMMFNYGEKNGFGKDLGEGGWTSKMTGSFAAKADVFGATLAKTASLQRAIWRNRLVIDIRDALLAAEVKGVRDLPRSDGQKFPDGMRYGHLNYMENGQKRTLVVPMQISSAFKRINIPMLNHLAKIPRFVHSLWRSCIIDWNPAYWPMNIRRNQDSIEHNMPGMKENYVKTALRLAPGTGPIADLAAQAVVRNLPVSAKMLGKTENIILPYIPQIERITRIIQDQNAWQREKWDAIDRNDLNKLQQLQDDWKMMEEMLRGNMFVSINGEYRGEPDMNAEADALAKKGLRTMLEEARLKNRQKSKKERLFDAVTLIFRFNQRQQQKEDILAKGLAYLADRKRYGLERTAKQSGLLVAERVSIAQGERKGYASDTMRLMVPFFNMIEKGVVRHISRYGIKGERKDVITQDAKFLFGSLTAGLLAKGLIQYWILNSNDGDEEKALKSPYGPLYRYSKFYHDAYRNCSEYVRKNYQFVPLWTKGYTSIIIGGAMTDEERILFPISDYTTDVLAASSGIAKKPSLGNTIMDSTVRLVVPDLEITGPLVETLRIAHAAVTGNNPMDNFRNAPMFDQRKIDMRYESWQDFAEFSSMIGAKLANYWGLRSVYRFDENGVDNGRGETPEPVEWAIRNIPWISPVFNRMVKIQVGSPERDMAPITAETRRIDSILSVCAERMLERKKDGMAFHEHDWKGYEAQIQKYAQTYKLDEFDVAKLKEKYLNGFQQWKCRDAYDQKTIINAREEARRQGRTESAVWVMLGER